MPTIAVIIVWSSESLIYLCIFCQKFWNHFYWLHCIILLLRVFGVLRDQVFEVMYVRVFGVVRVWEDLRWGVLGFSKRFAVEASSTFSGSNLWVARFVLFFLCFLSFMCNVVFSVVWLSLLHQHLWLWFSNLFHIFLSFIEFGFGWVLFCWFVVFRFGWMLLMEFSLNVYEIKFFLVIWCGFLLLLNISLLNLF